MEADPPRRCFKQTVSLPAFTGSAQSENASHSTEAP